MSGRAQVGLHRALSSPSLQCVAVQGSGFRNRLRPDTPKWSRELRGCAGLDAQHECRASALQPAHAIIRTHACTRTHARTRMHARTHARAHTHTPAMARWSGQSLRPIQGSMLATNVKTFATYHTKKGQPLQALSSKS